MLAKYGDNDKPRWNLIVAGINAVKVFPGNPEDGTVKAGNNAGSNG
jgi:hypothetical protein